MASFRLLFTSDASNFSLVQGGFKLNVSVHKQISDMLEEAGTMGMTLTVSSAQLCHITLINPFVGIKHLVMPVRPKNYRTHPHPRRTLPAPAAPRRSGCRRSTRN